MTRLLLLVLLCCAPQHFARPPASPLDFPTDHGNHADAQTEWWYLQGVLRTEAGRRLAVFLASVRHMADLDTGERVSERSRIDGFPLPGRFLDGTAGQFLLRAGRWRTWGGGGDFAWSVPSKLGRLSLQATPTTAPFAIGQDGRVEIGDTAFSYYTFPRVRVEGTLEHRGQTTRVTGEGWVDHQYGFIYTSRYRGWLWLAIMLEDGTDVLFSLIEPRLVGVQEATLGNVRFASGPSQSLTDVQVEAESTYVSQRHTGMTYPVTLRARAPEAGLDLVLTPLRADSEWRVQPVPLWEGPLTVEGTRDGVPVRGRAFAEYLKAGEHPLRPYVASGVGVGGRPGG